MLFLFKQFLKGSKFSCFDDDVADKQAAA